MSTEPENSNEYSVGTPRWVALAVVGLAAVSVLGVGIGWNANAHARNTEETLQAQTQQNKTLQQGIDKISARVAQSEDTNTQLQGELKLVTDRLKMTQGELANARQQARQIRTEYSSKLDSVQTEMAEKANASDVTALGGDINGVKGDLQSAKDNLQMARGEFGTLIARNHDEIEQLRHIGDREYYEFTLNGKGQRSKVGSLSMELRDTDTKKNQFTVALFVDDMRLEKKNRSVDEPIYFYMRGSRAPSELVINKVSKNQVTGYLSTPKAAPGAPSAGN
jgi:chromosome segregation ATPase